MHCPFEMLLPSFPSKYKAAEYVYKSGSAISIENEAAGKPQPLAGI
jgi:hypothetical protein